MESVERRLERLEGVVSAAALLVVAELRPGECEADAIERALDGRQVDDRTLIVVIRRLADDEPLP